MRRLKSIPPCGLQNVPYAGMKKKIPNIISDILKIILDILSIEYYNLAKDTINVQKMLYQIMKMDGGEFMSSKKTGKISLLLVIAMKADGWFSWMKLRSSTAWLRFITERITALSLC